MSLGTAAMQAVGSSLQSLTACVISNNSVCSISKKFLMKKNLKKFENFHLRSRVYWERVLGVYVADVKFARMCQNQATLQRAVTWRRLTDQSWYLPLTTLTLMMAYLLVATQASFLLPHWPFLKVEVVWKFEGQLLLVATRTVASTTGQYYSTVCAIHTLWHAKQLRAPRDSKNRREFTCWVCRWEGRCVSLCLPLYTCLRQRVVVSFRTTR